MSVFRIEKTSNYTVMSNHHFQEKNMSLKAKGLLSLMLSLPDSWDYSIAGLVSICSENETSIKSALKELRQFGYLEINKRYPDQSSSGRIEYEYLVYEQPKNIQDTLKQGVEILPVENQGQLNKKESNTKKEIIETKVSIMQKQKPLSSLDNAKNKQTKKASDIKTIYSMMYAFSNNPQLTERLQTYLGLRVKRGLLPEQWKIILDDLKQIYGHSDDEMISQVDNAIAGGYMQIVPSWEKNRKKTNKAFDNTAGRMTPSFSNLTINEKKSFEQDLAKDKEGKPMRF